jgi:DNA-directed RNA polymerase specialized sigma24 family protein
MRYRPAILEKQFKSFKDGQMEVIEEILASERERLFDYLIRMTGQLSKSMDTSIEASNVVGAVADHEESLQELLVVLYKTARNFAIDAWNADTSKLENIAYESEKSAEKKLIMISLEHVLRSLAPKQREILLLHERYGFAPDEICEITSFSMSDVEETFALTLGIVESAMSGNSNSVPELMTKLQVFPLPESNSDTTQNLSLVFKNLKKSSRRTPSAWLRLLLWILLVSGTVLSVWKYDYILKIFSEYLSSANE